MQETLLYLVQVSACRVNIEFFASSCEEIEPLSRLPPLPLIFFFFFPEQVYQLWGKNWISLIISSMSVFLETFLFALASYNTSKIYRLGKFDIIRDFWRLSLTWKMEFGVGTMLASYNCRHFVLVKRILPRLRLSS